jgi:hypothetical protein
MKSENVHRLTGTIPVVLFRSRAFMVGDIELAAQLSNVEIIAAGRKR